MKPRFINNKEGARLITELLNLLNARRACKKAYELTEEAEDLNTQDGVCLNFDRMFRVHKLRRDVLILWQEINNRLEQLQ